MTDVAGAAEAPLRDLLFRLMPVFFDEPRIEAVWVEASPPARARA